MIIGGGGDDLLRGRFGGDIYQYQFGDGNDIIDEYGFAARRDTDRLEFTDLRFSEITLARDFATRWDLIAIENITGAQIRIDDHFRSSNYGLEEITFADGITLDRAEIFDLAYHRDIGTIDIFARSKTGLSFSSGPADEGFYGSAGDDQFIFNPDFGRDRIYRFETGAASNDVLDLAALGVSNLDEVLAKAYETERDTIIDFGAEGEITLFDVRLTDLHPDDFRFA